VVLLPQEQLEGAKAVAGRMLEAVRQLHIAHQRSSCAPQVTVSLGVATMVPARGSSPLDLLAIADARLYQAKTGGRNRYCAAEE
jgi:diguanylate cyclase (GGDEF)-like protein